MNLLLFVSEITIPLLVFGVVAYGITNRQPVYEDFITGAKDGMKTVFGIMPTLIGLMIAVGILRASGFLDYLTNLLSCLIPDAVFPSELLPLSIVKLFSSSASTGLLLDIYKEHGADSVLGKMASIMMSSTETVFYTMSVYFMSVSIKKSRYTLAGAMVATIAGLIASIYFAKFI